MKAANGKLVYKKLRKLYGNSFNNIIVHHSSHVFAEDNPDNIKAAEALTLLDGDISEENAVDAGECLKDICPVVDMELKETFLDPKANDVHYLIDGCFYSEEYEYTSEKVQRQIEDVAKKVTKSIFGAKGLNK